MPPKEAYWKHFGVYIYIYIYTYIYRMLQIGVSAVNIYIYDELRSSQFGRRRR